MLVAVILGNRMNDDGTVSALMAKRLELAIRLFNGFNPDKMILSGGIANEKAGIAEASKMYEYLVERGLPKEKLVMEDRSHTTKENALYSVEIAKKLGADEVIICTTNEHMSRTLLNPIKLFAKQLSGSGITLSAFSGE